MKHTSKILLIGLLLFIAAAALNAEEWQHPRSVADVLQSAGDNRPELEAVLDHYIAANEPQKLMAAYYLIENMSGHSFVEIALYDSTETEIEYDVLAYPDFNTLVADLDSIEAARGELSYDRKEKREDVTHITAEHLIQNIDLAFQVWRERPWAHHLSFQDFCHYVLPYRGSNEPLEEWRSHFIARFADLPDQMDDPSDPVEAAARINDDIKSWFTFDERYYCHPTDQGLSEMLTTKMGRCEDMTNLAIFAMRANGLAVTSDYTPYWADTGNNHAWNGLLDRDGTVVMFMGCESNPGDYQLNHRMAKVYRKMFHEQPDNLAFQKPEWEKVPGWLAGKSYLDVTADYTPVADVTVPLTHPQPDSVNYSYLCVFNSGEWSAIHWGEIEGDSVTFTDMGTDIAYLPMYLSHEELIPAGDAFILQKDGTTRLLVVQADKPTSLHLLSTTKRKVEQATDTVEQVFFEAGREYELFYWQDEWVSVATTTAADQPLEFADVPGEGLYWLVAKDSRKDERIFTYDDSAQVWW